MFFLINTAFRESGFHACISPRITTVIQVVIDHQINYNCFNEPFAVLPCEDLYWDMHGLIFETSIWLLAGSTRFLSAFATGAPSSDASANDTDERVHCSELVDSFKIEILIEQNSYFTLRRGLESLQRDAAGAINLNCKTIQTCKASLISKQSPSDAKLEYAGRMNTNSQILCEALQLH